MFDTLSRYLFMLELIPRSPASIKTDHLKVLLEQRGLEISLRSIQRDLNKLSQFFPLLSDDARPQGWSWQPEARQFSLPSLNPHTALTFHMLKQHMENILPPTTLEHLHPWFYTAEAVLGNHGGGIAKWPQKLRVLSPGMPRMTPMIDSGVQSTVFEAVLREKQIEASYLANGADKAWTRIIHPLALVVRDRVIYLLATIDGYKDVRQLVLHRIQRASLLESSTIYPPNFDLDKTIAQGEFSIPLSSTPIRLEAWFSNHLAIHLAESPISPDQEISYADEDGALLTATVPDSFELRIWLRSFGDEVAVIKPAKLRREFRAMSENLLSYYKDCE